MIQANTQPAANPALPPGRAPGSEQMQQYLTFVLSSEVFAIGILAIKEIIEYAHLTAVPMTPEYVRGGDQSSWRRGAGARFIRALWQTGEPGYQAHLHRDH